VLTVTVTLFINVLLFQFLQVLAVTVTRFRNVFCSSERFLVRISKEGFSNYVEKLHSNCTIFTVSLHQSFVQEQ